MRDYLQLPAGYRKLTDIDLQNNKKEMLLVNGGALVLMVLCALPGMLRVPISALFDTGDMLAYALRFVALAGGTVLYLVLHELVHGIFMWYYTKVKPRYGFTGLYAYAGSDAYFCRTHYLIVALAPVVLWGAVLAVLTALAGPQWFWVVYFIQIFNISGAAGDLYVTWRLLRMSQDILITDSGVAMQVFTRE